MKLSLFALVLICIVSDVSAQIQLPDLSPEGRIIQRIGYTNFIIRYERPATRGRKIMGDLVPNDKLWRTGAGKCTTIQFDQPLKIQGKSIQQGAYALVTIPSQNEWIVLFNSDTTKIYGESEDYDKRKEAIRFSVKPQKTDRFYESLTIDLDISNNNGIFYLSWENTQLSFPIQTNCSELTEDKIQSALKATPNDPELLSSVAYYYEMNNTNLKEAFSLVEKAIHLKEDRWYYRLAVDISAKMKDYEKAIKFSREGISYLEKTKPVEWEESVQSFKNDIKDFSVKK